MTRPPSQVLKDRWLDALVPIAAAKGWNTSAARRAAHAAGLSDDAQALAAPGGVSELVEHFFDRAETRAAAALAETDMTTLRVHEKVAAGVRAWLDTLGDREAVRRAIGWGAAPWRAGQPAARAWSVADMVWTAAGDESEDYNRYTKRGLLASTLPAIVFHWLDEADSGEIDAHIMRRLKGAMRFGQIGGRVLGPILRRAS